MSFPVRCFTCGAVHIYESYEKLIEKGLTPLQALEKLKITRICCRGLYLCHVNVLDTLVKYNNVVEDDID